MTTRIIALLGLSLLTGCSTAAKHPRVVMADPWPVTQTIQQQVIQPQVIQASTHENASQEQAKTVCETASMRQNVVDYDNTNDTVRIMTVQDSSSSSRVLSEVQVDCRDYFLRKSLSSKQPQLVRASTAETIEAPRRNARTIDRRYTYIVQSGDTVWDIAREHCTTVKAITRLNGLGRGNVLDIGQRLKLPDEECK